VFFDSWIGINLFTMGGLEPPIQLGFRQVLDHRVKPGDGEGEDRWTSGTLVAGVAGPAPCDAR
jgi:hypothetical protein